MLTQPSVHRAARGLLVCLSFAATTACSWFRSTVNDSPGLRWWLFSNFGAKQVCPKVLASTTTGKP